MVGDAHMNTGKIIYALAMGWPVIIYGGITYLFAKRKDYFLLNGYENRPAEEKEYLKQSGYLEANGKLLVYTFWLLFITFIIGFFPVPFGFEIGMGAFLIILLGGLFWVQRYEVPHKRKRMRWIAGSIAVATIGFVGWISFDGLVDNTFIVTEDTFEVTGSYGFEWRIDEITDVQLLDALPEVRMKTNGTSLGGVSKGKFRIEEPYGTGRLLIQNGNKTNDVLYIETTEDFVMISRNTDEETRELYEEVLEAVQ